MLGGGLYASARLGFQPQVGSVDEVSRFSRGVGLETRPGPIHPTPGMDLASLVCALASLSVWWRHGEWALFPGCPLARGPRRSPAAPPPPPPPPFRAQMRREVGEGGVGSVAPHHVPLKHDPCGTPLVVRHWIVGGNSRPKKFSPGAQFATQCLSPSVILRP